eukprot:TRINITY_DN1144_c0_g1_i2.p1 TRINITY_DN1144_c0_g1~~TRINITY_DN1144_c0_g1_i2.p1  ORF type:complete len:826 (-),score=181.56 TRINITY_DN1144_c0_g1_i2:53-2530(-)
MKSVVLLLLCLGVVYAATSCADEKLVVTTTEMGSGNIRWVEWSAGDKTTPETVYIVSGDHKVYRSGNAGKTFEKQDINDKIFSVHSTSNPAKFYFSGSSQALWVTNDDGKTYVARETPFVLLYVLPHPKQEDWVLALGYTQKCVQPDESGDCRTDLWLSNDLGKTWKLLKKYVKKALWGNVVKETVGDETVFVLCYTGEHASGDMRKKDRYNLEFQRTRDLFKLDSDGDYSKPHVIAFILYEDSILLGKLETDDDRSPIELWASLDDGTTFKKGDFPPNEHNLGARSYSILDMTERIAFVNVDHGAGNWGITYSSGMFDREFSDVLHYTNRSPWGAVDFLRMKGLDGIYLANRLPYDAKAKVPLRQPQTAITFDLGGEWQPLQAPTVDSEGKKISCSSSTCTLNLFGPAMSNYGRMYSVENAIGLIASTGIVSEYLVGNDPEAINTYFSRDAGLTWQEVAKGRHTYEFGDHGGLTVMTKTGDATKNVLFSWNEGGDWTECEFSNELIDATNIVIEPTATAVSFLLYGTRNNKDGTDTGVVVHLDFSTLHERECTADDYEEWSPKDGDGEFCLLGEKRTYLRRKPDAKCFNPKFDEAEQKETKADLCTCKREDYECDFCYDRDSNDKCVAICDDSDIIGLHEPATCKDVWYKTRGYRKVYSDKCIKPSDDAYAPIETKCSGSHDGGDGAGDGKSGGVSGGVIFVILLFIFLALLFLALFGVVAAARFDERVKSKIDPLIPSFLAGAWETLTDTSTSGASNIGSYDTLGGGMGGSLLDDLEDDDDDALDDHAEELDEESLAKKTEQVEGSSDDDDDDDDDFNPREEL